MLRVPWLEVQIPDGETLFSGPVWEAPSSDGVLSQAPVLQR